MIRKSIVAMILACAACCTVPLLIPGLAAVSALGLTIFGMKLSLDSVLCGLGLAAVAFIGVYFVVKALVKRPATSCGRNNCATDGSCGCK